MALGYEVNKGILDTKSAQAVLAMRAAFEKVESIAEWLADHPVPAEGGTDPLTTDPYNYTTDEAYAIRLYFETFNTVRTNNAAAFDAGRKMTGLE